MPRENFVQDHAQVQLNPSERKLQPSLPDSEDSSKMLLMVQKSK